MTSKIYLFFIILWVSAASFAQTKDYAGLPFTDQTLKFALGLSYSKLETYSETGNYFLLSNTNPKIEIKYYSKFKDFFRHIFYVGYSTELFTLENPQFVVKQKEFRHKGALAWYPQWFSQNMGYSYGFNTRLKAGSLISEVPDPFNIYGDIDDMFTAEAGINLVWYGQTVSRLPMSIDLDVAYSYVFGQHSVIQYKDGLVYRFGIDFDFNKRSFFANWNLRFYYEYEKIQTDLNPFVDKELGFTISKAFSF